MRKLSERFYEMLIRIDHLVILVRDLEHATEDYETLGFNVMPGGEHADGLTHNALIPFKDGGYLELVAFLDPDDPRDNVWSWRSFADSGVGLVDYCVASDDLARDVEVLRKGGFSVAGPNEGGRRLPDGTEIRWRVARFEQPGRVLPFLIEDLTDRTLRVPGSPATEHPNGATGLADITLAVPDLSTSADTLRVLVEDAAHPPHAEEYPTRFTVGAQTLTLTTPESLVDPVQQRLDAAGPGPFVVALEAGAEGGWLDRRRAHGVGISLASIS